MVARNNNGVVMLSVVTKERFVNFVIYAEIKAILFGIKLVMQQGFDSLMIESDTSLAISEIYKAENSLWEGGCLCSSCKGCLV
ncbi:hypothetical protein REPUB_Repub14bG0043500 [Reevesia pubescens]